MKPELDHEAQVVEFLEKSIGLVICWAELLIEMELRAPGPSAQGRDAATKDSL